MKARYNLFISHIAKEVKYIKQEIFETYNILTINAFP